MIFLAAETQNPLVPPLSELIIGLVCFLGLFWLLAKTAWPAINRTLAERTDAIEGGIKRAEEAQAEAKATLDQYRGQLSEARHEAARLREEATAQGAAIIAEMRQEAQDESRRLIAAAHAQIEAERAAAVASLRAEIGTMATDLASRIVGEALADSERQRRVVDRFLAELESGSSETITAGGAGDGS